MHESFCTDMPRSSIATYYACSRITFILYSFLADRTIGRAYATVLRPSVCRRL